MPFTLRNLREGTADFGSNFDGGLEIPVIGAPSLGGSPRDDVEGKRGWWADQGGS